MADDSFIQKYTQSEKIKRGIEVILKSDNYTDEYKALILKYLGENYSAPTEVNATPEQQLELMDKGGIVIEEGKTGLVKITDKKPASRGRLETPKYIESELVKAIDIVVDELISPPPKKSPPAVPLQTYLDLETAYSASVNEVEDYKDKYFTTLSDLDLANQTIELLNQSLDACEIQKAVAENQADTINSRYISLLGDFQSAIQKAIQEAIERVSLTAQVRGLQAQKESLKSQLDMLQSQLVGSTAETTATAAGLFPSIDGEFFYGTTSDQSPGDRDLAWTTSRDNAVTPGLAGEIEIKNLKDNLSSIVKLSIQSYGDLTYLGPIGFADGGYSIGDKLGVGWADPRTKPAAEIDTNILAGAGQKFELFFNTFIGGKGKSPVNPNASGQNMRNYNGTYIITVTYADGSTSVSNEMSWNVRKNQG